MEEQNRHRDFGISRQGRSTIATKLLLLLLLMTLLPVGITAFLMFTTTGSIQRVALQEGRSALIENYESYLSDRTRDYAEALSKELTRIEDEAATIAAVAAMLYSNPGSFDIGSTRTYARHELGFLWTPEDQGSNVFAGSGFGMSDRVLREILLTEYLDPVLESIYESDENVSYVYFTSASGFARGYPWFDAEAVISGGTLQADIELLDHPIFFLADPEHNPERRAVWSEVYPDAAGRGFMVTCSYPVYRTGGLFAGVVGIDVTVELLSRKILELRSGDSGYAFLVGRHGALIAFTENASADIGYTLGDRLDRYNLFERAGEGLHGVLADMSAGSSGIRRITVNDVEKIIAYYPVLASDWMLGFVVPVEWITRAAFRTGEKIRARTGILRQQMVLIFAMLVIAVLLVTVVASRKIAHPVRELATGAQRIGSGDLAYRVPELTDDEIGDLAHSFNEMADSLKQRDEELSRVQQELIAAESLSSMGKVAAGVAHEIRNALGVIKNSLYYLKGKIHPAAGEEKRDAVLRHMGIMEREIVASERIISDLLTFSSPVIPQVRIVDLHRLLRDTVERVSFRPSVEVSFDFGQGTRRTSGDPLLLGQVFFNILQNAKQALPEERGLVKISTRAAGEGIEVSISDNGPGVSEENLAFLFEPFFTTKAKGIGLGLSLSKRIVEEHGGRIGVESTLGEGTTFTITLKKAADETKAAD